MALGRKDRNFTIIYCSASGDDKRGSGGGEWDGDGRDVDDFDDEPSQIRSILPVPPSTRRRPPVNRGSDIVVHRPLVDEQGAEHEDILHIGQMLGLDALVDIDVMYSRTGLSGVSLATRVRGKVRALKKSHRSLAAKLMTLWARYNPPRDDDIDSARYHRTELFETVLEGVINIVSIKGLYSVAKHMLASQENTKVPEIEDHILSLGRKADLFAGLPPKVRKVYKGMIKDRAEQAGDLPYVFYDDMLSLLDTLSPFSENDPSAAYDLESRIGPRYSYVAPFNPDSVGMLRGLESEPERILASALLMRWHDYREARRGMPELFNSLGDTGNRSILTGFSQVAKSVDIYLVVNRMLDVQDRVVSPFLEEDIKSLCRQTDNYLNMPRKAQEFFLSHVEDHVESATKRNCARFNHIPDILQNLASFTDDSHPKAYRLAQKVKDKDTNGVLHSLYAPLGKLDCGVSECTLRIIDRVLDFIPEDCYLDDPEVKKIHRFLKRVPVIESLPSRLQDIIEKRVDSIDGLYRKNRTPEAQHRHDIWNTVKQMQKLAGNELHEDVYDLVDMINDVDDGKVYHFMLRFVGLPPDAPDAAIDAAKQILSYLPHAELPEDYDIRRVRRRDDVRWVTENLIKIMDAVRKRSENPVLCKLVTPGVEIVKKYGPDAVPASERNRLRPVLEGAFGKVGRIWDWRALSKDYWKYEDPVAIYECMSRTGLPVDAVRKLPHDLHSIVMPATGKSMIGSMVAYMAACCGTFWRESEFYDALLEVGVDGILDIHDNSRVMIARARVNCSRQNLQPGVHIGDIADLSLSHVSMNRQALVSILGESDGNRLPEESRTTLRAFCREARYRYTKRGGNVDACPQGYTLYPDILVIDGSDVKDSEKYEKGWPFIWNALNSVLGYNLDLFTDDGRMCYLTNQNPNGTVEVFFYNNHTRGELRKGDVIWAIDAKALVEDIYAAGAREVGLASRFINYDDKVVAVLYLPQYDFPGS